MSDMPIGCPEHTISRADAKRGSAMLRDAILRAKGYSIPKIIAPLMPKIEAPAFRNRRRKMGRPRGKPLGWKKALRHHPKVAQIQAVVAMHFGLTLDELLDKSKKDKFVVPRQIAMYASRKTTTVSYPDIGFQFGGKNHATVIHAVRTIEKRIGENDERTIAALSALHAVIGS